MPDTILAIAGVSKRYASGLQALHDVDLTDYAISIVCGIVNASGGTVTVYGLDMVRDWRQARSIIGLVPQELTSDAFETVANACAFSRGLFGKPRSRLKN